MFEVFYFRKVKKCILHPKIFIHTFTQLKNHYMSKHSSPGYIAVTICYSVMKPIVIFIPYDCINPYEHCGVSSHIYT